MVGDSGVRFVLVAADPELEKRAEEDRTACDVGRRARHGRVRPGDAADCGNGRRQAEHLLRSPDSQHGADAGRSRRARDLRFAARCARPDAAPGIVETGDREGAPRSSSPVRSRPGRRWCTPRTTSPTRRDTAQIVQTWPASLQNLNLIVLQIGGLEVRSARIAQKREVTDQGQQLIVASGPAISAGQALELEISGSAAPSRLAAIRRVEPGDSVIIGAGIWAAATPTSTPQSGISLGVPSGVDFESVEAREVSRHFGRRRALSRVNVRLSVPARSSACSVRTAPASRRSSRCFRRSCSRRPGEVRFGDRPAGRARRRASTAHRRARSRPVSLRRPHRVREPGVLRPAVRSAVVDAGGRGRVGALDGGSRAARARRSRLRRFHAGCVSGSRSSARCCTSRGSCCSTSRSRASTTIRPRRWRRGCGPLRESRRDRRDGDARLRERRRRGRSCRCASGTAARVRSADGGGPIRERYRRSLQEAWTMSGVLRAAWLIARKDLRVEARNREIAYTTLFFAMACVLVFAFAFVVRGPSDRRRGGGHPLGGRRVFRHTGARPGVRARAPVRDAAGAAAGARRARGRLSRQAAWRC